MKAFAVTKHECIGCTDVTDTLVGVFFKREDANSAAENYFSEWIAEIDINEIDEATRERIWEEPQRTLNELSIQVKDGWSLEHLVVKDGGWSSSGLLIINTSKRFTLSELLCYLDGIYNLILDLKGNHTKIIES